MKVIIELIYVTVKNNTVNIYGAITFNKWSYKITWNFIIIIKIIILLN